MQPCPPLQLQSEMRQQPLRFGEVRASHRCVPAVCVPVASLQIRPSGSTELHACPSACTSLVWMKPSPFWQTGHFLHTLSKQLHIQASPYMFHCLILYSFLPRGRKLTGQCCNGAANYHAMPTSSHIRSGEALPVGNGCCLLVYSHGRSAGEECSRNAALLLLHP